MAEIINLRRARKAKARTEKDRVAQANRIAHGTPKALKKLEAAKLEQAAERLSGHELEKAGSVGEVPSDSVGTSDQKEDDN